MITDNDSKLEITEKKDHATEELELFKFIDEDGGVDIALEGESSYAHARFDGAELLDYLKRAVEWLEIELDESNP